ncbi:32523_t:CDS:2, partial [Gigaspora margarita]
MVYKTRAFWLRLRFFAQRNADSPYEGEELHLPGLQVLILEKYIDYATKSS